MRLVYRHVNLAVSPFAFIRFARSFGCDPPRTAINLCVTDVDVVLWCSGQASCPSIDIQIRQDRVEAKSDFHIASSALEVFESICPVHVDLWVVDATMASGGCGWRLLI